MPESVEKTSLVLQPNQNLNSASLCAFLCVPLRFQFNPQTESELFAKARLANFA
jgi:hypothetical protein